jgi:hypothetical protein
VPGTAYENSYFKSPSMNSGIEEWVFSTPPSEPENWYGGTTSHGYDGRGNTLTVLSGQPVWAWVGPTDPFPDPYAEAELRAEHETAARSYYSADDRLMVHQITRDSIDHSGALPDTADSLPSRNVHCAKLLRRRKAD